MAFGVLSRSSELPPLPPLSVSQQLGAHAGAHVAAIARVAGMISAAGISPVISLMWPETEKKGTSMS